MSEIGRSVSGGKQSRARKQARGLHIQQHIRFSRRESLGRSRTCEFLCE
jgi:hypothetical protein